MCNATRHIYMLNSLQTYTWSYRVLFILVAHSTAVIEQQLETNWNTSQNAIMVYDIILVSYTTMLYEKPTMTQ